jgi:hypothetical protein
MTFKKLKTLLLIDAVLGTILCSGQTDTGKVCLTYSEFDFYAEKLVRAEGLARDTAILHNIIQKQDSVRYHTERCLEECMQNNLTYSLQVQESNITIGDLRLNLEKSRRATKIFQGTSLGLLLYVVIKTAVEFLRP